MSICLFLGLIKICFWLVSHFLPLSLFVFPHSLPLLPAGEADSGQGACFLWPGCRSRTHLSPGRVKEHRLRNSLSPALFLWHGFLTLVSTHNFLSYQSFISLSHCHFEWTVGGTIGTRLFASCFLYSLTILSHNLCTTWINFHIQRQPL